MEVHAFRSGHSSPRTWGLTTLTSYSAVVLQTVTPRASRPLRGSIRQLPSEPLRRPKGRVVHGLVAEWSLALGILLVFGGVAFAVFLLQALFAFRALEVVNYFEHWGLVRSGPRVRAVDSWDTDSWVTYYSLTGLSRHADHHGLPSRPYQELRVRGDSPRLPGGYLSIFPLILLRNKKSQRLMAAELER